MLWQSELLACMICILNVQFQCCVVNMPCAVSFANSKVPWSNTAAQQVVSAALHGNTLAHQVSQVHLSCVELPLSSRNALNYFTGIND